MKGMQSGRAPGSDTNGSRFAVAITRTQTSCRWQNSWNLRGTQNCQHEGNAGNNHKTCHQAHQHKFPVPQPAERLPHLQRGGGHDEPVADHKYCQGGFQGYLRGRLFLHIDVILVDVIPGPHHHAPAFTRRVGGTEQPGATHIRVDVNGREEAAKADQVVEVVDAGRTNSDRLLFVQRSLISINVPQARGWPNIASNACALPDLAGSGCFS